MWHRIRHAIPHLHRTGARDQPTSNRPLTLSISPQFTSPARPGLIQSTIRSGADTLIKSTLIISTHLTALSSSDFSKARALQPADPAGANQCAKCPFLSTNVMELLLAAWWHRGGDSQPYFRLSENIRKNLRISPNVEVLDNVSKCNWCW